MIIVINMVGRGIDILFGGSFVGLVKCVLKEKFWFVFDLGDIGDVVLFMYVDLF